MRQAAAPSPAAVAAGRAGRRALVGACPATRSRRWKNGSGWPRWTAAGSWRLCVVLLMQMRRVPQMCCACQWVEAFTFEAQTDSCCRRCGVVPQQQVVASCPGRLGAEGFGLKQMMSPALPNNNQQQPPLSMATHLPAGPRLPTGARKALLPKRQPARQTAGRPRRRPAPGTSCVPLCCVAVFLGEGVARQQQQGMHNDQRGLCRRPVHTPHGGGGG